MTQFSRYVSAEQLGHILGVTRQMICKYVKQGMPKHARGKYDIAVCVQWVIERFKANRDDKNDNSELCLERLKLYQSQRIKTDLENEKTRREVLPVEEVAETFNAMAAEVAIRLDAVGGRLASVLAGLKNPAEVQAVLLSEMREIRSSIVDSWDRIAEQEARKEGNLML